ncbi:hypothetical protein [Nocardia sp. NPDC004260]
MLNATEADKSNRAAEFHPQTSDETRPCIEVAGVLVFTYIDDNGVVRVSVHLDTTDAAVHDIRGLVPIRIVLEDSVVFDSEQDPTPHTATSTDIAFNGPEFNAEDRTIELRIDETILVKMAEENWDIDDWPHTDRERRKLWLNIVTGLIDRVNRCDGLLTMSTPARWRQPAIQIAYDLITDACTQPRGIAIHLRTVDTGSEICSRRYFNADDMQFITADGRITDEPDIEDLLRGLVRDLEVEINNLYREFAD